MEIIVVLAIAGLILAVLIVGAGSFLGRRRGSDELQAERGADDSPQEGMGGKPVRDRPGGAAAESQNPELAGGDLHPPEQQGEGAEDAAMPSEAAGKRDPRENEGR